MIGEIKGYGGTTAPPLHLMCDGAAVSRTKYKRLFDFIGTIYGAGDGSTTFNLPSAKGCRLVGYDPSDPDFDTVGKKGGSNTYNFQHTHTQTDHNHQVSGTTDNSSGPNGSGSGKTVAATVHNHPFGTVTSGGASNLGMDSQLSATQSVINPNVTINLIIQYDIRKSKAFPLFAFIH